MVVITDCCKYGLGPTNKHALTELNKYQKYLCDNQRNKGELHSLYFPHFWQKSLSKQDVEVC